MILAIDLKAVLYRLFFAGGPRQSSDLPERFESSVYRFAKEVGATHWVMAFETGPTFRNELWVAYKAARRPAPTALGEQFPKVLAWAARVGLPVVERRGFEADDVLAAIAHEALLANEAVTFVSDDKDMAQALEAGVQQLRPARKGPERIADQFTVYREWGVPPARIPDLFGLMGDSVDGIPGVPRIGHLKAKRLLDRFGSLDGILIADSTLNDDVRLVIEHRVQAEVSRDLATLRSGLGLGRCWVPMTKQPAREEAPF